MHGRAAKWNYYIETTGAQVQHVARGALPRVCIDACGRRDRKTTTYTHSTGMREITVRIKLRCCGCGGGGDAAGPRRRRERPCRPIAVGWSTELPAGETGQPLLLRARGKILHRAHRVAGCGSTTLPASAVDGAWPSTARLVKDRTFHAPNQQRAGGWARAPFLRPYTASVGLSCVRYRLRRWSPAQCTCTHCTTVVTVDVYIRAAGLVSLPAASGCVRGHATKLRSGVAFAMWQCSSANTVHTVQQVTGSRTALRWSKARLLKLRGDCVA